MISLKGVTAYTEWPQSQPGVKKWGVSGFSPSYKSLIKNSLYVTKSIIFFLFYLFLWLLWVFVAILRLSLFALHGGYSLSCRVWVSYCCGFSCCKAWGLGHTGSTVVAHGLSCPMAYGIFPDKGSNPCPHQILNHWWLGSPKSIIFHISDQDSRTDII